MANASKVSDIMTREVEVLREEDNLTSLASIFDRYGFRHLPVVDGRKLVGMLSQRDLLRATVAGLDHSAVARDREAHFLERTFVRDIMMTPVLTTSVHELVRDAARRMATARIGALPVVDEAGDLVGILTESDILRLAAERL